MNLLAYVTPAFGWINWSIVIVYLLGMVGIGHLASRRRLVACGARWSYACAAIVASPANPHASATAAMLGNQSPSGACVRNPLAAIIPSRRSRPAPA